MADYVRDPDTHKTIYAKNEKDCEDLARKAHIYSTCVIDCPPGEQKAGTPGCPSSMQKCCKVEVAPTGQCHGLTEGGGGSTIPQTKCACGQVEHAPLYFIYNPEPSTNPGAANCAAAIGDYKWTSPWETRPISDR